MRSASGFPCPKCKDAKMAYIESDDVVHILELRCSKCSNRWAVENSYPASPSGFMDSTGRAP